MRTFQLRKVKFDVQKSNSSKKKISRATEDQLSIQTNKQRKSNFDPEPKAKEIFDPIKRD